MWPLVKSEQGGTKRNTKLVRVGTGTSTFTLRSAHYHKLVP